MKALINKFTRVLAQQDPALDPCFNSPATKKQVSGAEARLGVQFPRDLQSFLLAVNGQSDPNHAVVEGDVVIPRLRFGKDQDQFTAEGWFADVDTIVELTLFDRKHRVTKPIPKTKRWGPVKSHSGLICITKSETPWWLALDLVPDNGGQIGQVVSVSEFPEHTVCIAATFSDFILRLVKGFSDKSFTTNEDGYLIES